jgi:hypothetical protein
VKHNLLSIALLVVLVPGLVCGLGLASASRTMRGHFLASRDSTRAEAALTAPFIQLARRRLAGETDLGLAPATGADAAPVLNPRLEWSDEPRKLFWASAPRALAQLRAWDTTWVNHLADLDPDESTVDLHWMTDLGRFSRWTLPLYEVRKGEDRAPWIRTSGWGDAGKLLLMRGMREGKPEQAAADVHALAMLLYRSGDARCVQQGLLLLRQERSAFDAYVLSGKATAGWTPWPADKIAALVALHEAAAPMLGTYGSDALAEDMLAEDIPAPIRCAAKDKVIQALAPGWDIRDPDLEPALARARGWLANPQGCSFANARARWGRGPLRQFEHDDIVTTGSAARLIAVMPPALLTSLRGAVFLSSDSVSCDYMRVRIEASTLH